MLIVPTINFKLTILTFSSILIAYYFNHLSITLPKANANHLNHLILADKINNLSTT